MKKVLQGVDKTSNGLYISLTMKFSQNLLKEFTSSLRHGTGKAFEILTKHPELPVDDLLIDAALHNYDLDPQSSGSHAFQVGELLKLRPDYPALMLRIAERFAAEFEFQSHDEFNWRYWDVVQLYDLLAHHQATPRITEIIRNRFVRRHRLETNVGHDSFIEADGSGGLLRVAKTLGASLTADPNFPIEDWLWSGFPEPPDLDCRKILETESANAADIQAFFTAFRDFQQKEENHPHKPSPPPDLKMVISYLEQKKRCSFYRIQLTKADQAKLRQRLKQETNGENLATICHVLARTGGVTPAMIPVLSELCHHRYEWAADKAIMALSSLTDKRVREIALKEIPAGPDGWKFVELLEKNWQPGDEKLFLKVFNALRSPHTRHAVIWSAWSAPEAPVSLLKYLYWRSSCGNCREKIARQLAKKNGVDEELRRCFLHDSQEEIREIGQAQH